VEEVEDQLESKVAVKYALALESGGASFSGVFKRIDVLSI